MEEQLSGACTLEIAAFDEFSKLLGDAALTAEFDHIVFVTLPEATPVHEAAALQDDLRRADIEPFAWVINQSFVESGSNDPLLRQRAQNEVPFIHEVADQPAVRTALAPWVADEPVGPERLRQLVQTNTQPVNP